MISDLKHLCPYSPMWDYGKNVEPSQLRERPTKANDTYFDEMISLRLKELDYDQKKKVFEFIETLRAARREARGG
ncbi:hypothetical protein DO021_02970 [Desulfobacter hydrogenophilus]|uniref:Uncharacterized protein n=1 Tax=Desulfobacter hydrogenophilus TaxID=2291 RepID=A0A328FGF3_9BACT|nr:hypothetical protein [Desulfobacter hydrogenophilus]RAM03489.1 hypothetical protein DO021_02970 [Desulfobacter hydrogenophilus]